MKIKLEIVGADGTRKGRRGRGVKDNPHPSAGYADNPKPTPTARHWQKVRFSMFLRR